MSTATAAPRETLRQRLRLGLRLRRLFHGTREQFAQFAEQFLSKYPLVSRRALAAVAVGAGPQFFFAAAAGLSSVAATSSALDPSAAAASALHSDKSSTASHPSPTPDPLEAGAEEEEEEEEEAPPAGVLGRIRQFLEAIGEGLYIILRAVYLVYLFLPVGVVYLMAKAFPRLNETWWSMLVRQIEKAGAAYIKFGQWAATRVDMFPEEMCKRLARLQNSAPVHSLATTDQIMFESFGKHVEDLFGEFDPKPIGSGSVGQVYKAVLKGTNQKVAVKVRHPWVRDQFRRDLKVIHWLARQLGRFPRYQWLELPISVDEFAKILEAQVDFSLEAQHLSRFRQNFIDFPNISFPRPLYPFVSESVLVETFEEGLPVSKFVTQRHPANRQIARMGLDTFLKMLLVDNFVHADAHPENILVRIDEKGQPKIVMLDVGIVSEIKPRDQKNVITLFKAVTSQDGIQAAELMVSMQSFSSDDPSLKVREQRHRAFRKDMASLFDEFSERPHEFDLSEMLTMVFSLVRKHKVKLESNFAMLVVTMGLMEGICHQLDPTMNLFWACVPYVAAGDNMFSKIGKYLSGAAPSSAREAEKEVMF